MRNQSADLARAHATIPQSRRHVLVVCGDVVAVHKDGDVVEIIVIVKDVTQIDA